MSASINQCKIRVKNKCIVPQLTLKSNTNRKIPKIWSILANKAAKPMRALAKRTMPCYNTYGNSLLSGRTRASASPSCIGTKPQRPAQPAQKAAASPKLPCRVLQQPILKKAPDVSPAGFIVQLSSRQHHEKPTLQKLLGNLEIPSFTPIVFPPSERQKPSDDSAQRRILALCLHGGYKSCPPRERCRKLSGAPLNPIDVRRFPAVPIPMRFSVPILMRFFRHREHSSRHNLPRASCSFSPPRRCLPQRGFRLSERLPSFAQNTPRKYPSRAEAAAAASPCPPPPAVRVCPTLHFYIL